MRLRGQHVLRRRAQRWPNEFCLFRASMPVSRPAAAGQFANPCRATGTASDLSCKRPSLQDERKGGARHGLATVLRAQDGKQAYWRGKEKFIWPSLCTAPQGVLSRRRNLVSPLAAFLSGVRVRERWMPAAVILPWVPL